jgi:hypothetical protein
MLVFGAGLVKEEQAGVNGKRHTPEVAHPQAAKKIGVADLTLGKPTCRRPNIAGGIAHGGRSGFPLMEDRSS